MQKKLFVMMPCLSGMAPVIGDVQPEGENEVLVVSYHDSEFNLDDEEEEG